MDNQGGERPPARRARGKRWLKGALVVLCGAAFVWLLAPTVFGGPEPPPLWTDADLPAAPPATENGWHDLALPARSTVELPGELRALLRPDEEGRPWVERARALRAPLAATLDGEPAREALAAFERAIGKPRFADACPVTLEEPCRVLPLLSVHRTALLASLRRAEGGDWPSALTLLAKTLRADVDFATTSRSLVTHMIALANLREAADLATDLFETYRAERARDPSIPPPGEGAVAALASVDAELSRLDPSALDARRALVADYLIARKAPDYIATTELFRLQVAQKAADDETTASRLFRHLAPLLLDRGATQTELNARFTALRDAIVASAPPPSFRSEHEEPFWWHYNLTGKLLLDAMLLDWSGPLRTVSEGRARIEARRPGLRKLSQDLSRS